jgi:hypothetical protein
MSQCNPREDNGYHKEAEALNGAEIAADPTSNDTTDSKGMAYPVEPKPASPDHNLIARYQQVRSSTING